MSITPRPPPRSRRSVDRGSGETTPWYDRALARLVTTVRGAGRWLRRRLERDEHEREFGNRAAPADPAGTRTPPRALAGGSQERHDKREADVVASLPGTAVLEEPELPPRPDLELEQTEAGLRIRRPGREEAYIASDEWLDVKR